MRIAIAYFVVLLAGLATSLPAQSPEYVAYVWKHFTETEARYRQESRNEEAVTQFARACFNVADIATNKTQRAEFAQIAISACRTALELYSNSGSLHLHLAVNLGQLAQTKGLGALRLLGQMKQEFLRAIELSPSLDFAGGHRGLGLLQRDAPSFTVGDKVEARKHLQKAVELAPDFPENRLNLIEAYLQWGEMSAARRELGILQRGLPDAKAKFSGVRWEFAWEDWTGRLNKVQKRL